MHVLVSEYKECNDVVSHVAESNKDQYLNRALLNERILGSNRYSVAGRLS